MGAAGSKGKGGNNTRPDVHKKGIAALIKPLRAPGLQIRPGQSISETGECWIPEDGLLTEQETRPMFNVMSLATNLSQRFSVLSGLSFISLGSAPTSADSSRRKLTRTRYRGGSISGTGKTPWPVAQTEVLFLPEFPVGTDQKMQLIFYGEVSRGAFGQVFHVQCSNTLQHFAMKVLAKSQVCSLDVVKQVKQEVMIQQMCSHHPFITPLTHHWQTRKLLIVMTEYVAYGELHQLWQSLGVFPENLVALYIAEIAVTIDFLHNAGIIYRDLKMENLLLDEDGHIKLIDFGLAKWLKYGSKTGSICGTLNLMAPEVCTGTWYSHSVDWWSLGIIAYCMVVGRYPVPLQLNHTAMVQAIAKCAYGLPSGTSPGLVSLVGGLLDRDPMQRTHSLVALQQELLYRGTDLDCVVEKQVVPRKLLEEYIETKTRQNFEDFAGLTSTPKRYQKSSELYPTSDQIPKLSSSPGINHTGMSSPALQGKTLGLHKRSASSPLLHPGRLGHHESLLKHVSVGVTNGAAVPILQSPLLRLARQHCLNQVTCRTNRAARLAPRQHAHSFVNITALPSTPSPCLLHSSKVRERKQRYKGSKKQPSLPTLQQENSTFDSMRMSSSINEIPSCLEESSSSTSCEKMFSSHSYHGNSSSDSYSSRRDNLRPLSAEYSSRILSSRNSLIGVQIRCNSPPLSSSPIHTRSGGVPFISTLPPIASSPLPPSTPNSTSPYPPSSPLPADKDQQHSYGSTLFPPTAAFLNSTTGDQNLLSPFSIQISAAVSLSSTENFPINPTYTWSESAAPYSQDCPVTRQFSIPTLTSIPTISLDESVCNNTSNSQNTAVCFALSTPATVSITCTNATSALSQPVITSTNPSLQTGSQDACGHQKTESSTSFLSSVYSTPYSLTNSNLERASRFSKQGEDLEAPTTVHIIQPSPGVALLAEAPQRLRQSRILNPSYSLVQPNSTGGGDNTLQQSCSIASHPRECKCRYNSSVGEQSPSVSEAATTCILSDNNSRTAEDCVSNPPRLSSDAGTNRFSYRKLSHSYKSNDKTSMPLNASFSDSSDLCESRMENLVNTANILCSGHQPSALVSTVDTRQLVSEQCSIQSKLKTPCDILESRCQRETSSSVVDKDPILSSGGMMSSFSAHVVVEKRNSNESSERSNQNTSPALDRSKLSYQDKLLAFHRSRDKITAFQRDLMKYDSQVHERKNTAFIFPEPRGSTVKNPVCNTTTSSYTIPNTNTLSNISKLRTSPLMGYRPSSTPTQRRVMSHSPTAVIRSTSIRTSPLFWYNSGVSKSSCLDDITIPHILSYNNTPTPHNLSSDIQSSDNTQLHNFSSNMPSYDNTPLQNLSSNMPSSDNTPLRTLSSNVLQRTFDNTGHQSLPSNVLQTPAVAAPQCLLSNAQQTPENTLRLPTVLASSRSSPANFTPDSLPGAALGITVSSSPPHARSAYDLCLQQGTAAVTSATMRHPVGYAMHVAAANTGCVPSADCGATNITRCYESDANNSNDTNTNITLLNNSNNNSVQ